VSVDGRDDIEEAAYDDELGAVVGGGDLDGRGAEIEDTGEDVEDSVADITGEVEDVQDLSGVRRVDLAFEREAQGEHSEDRDGDETSANPFAKHEMTCSGDKPACDEDHRGKG